MALLDVFKKQKEAEMYGKKRKSSIKTTDAEIPTESAKTEKSKTKALAKASVFASGKNEAVKNKQDNITPYVTEKGTLLEKNGAYLFKVEAKINKIMMKREIKAKYKVSPIKVNIINISDKEKFVRRTKGVKKGFKKAMVFLKKGDKIEV